MRLASLMFVVCTAGFSGTWSRFLVDSDCWTNRQNNVSADAATGSRDMMMDLRYCSPTAGTRKFAIVLSDCSGLKLDNNGNRSASQIVQSACDRCMFDVTASGNLNKKTISVDAISSIAFSL